MLVKFTPVSGWEFSDPVADLIKQASELAVIGAPLTSLLTSVVDGFGKLIGLAAGESLSQDSLAGLNSLTTAGAAEFNARVAKAR